MVKQSIMSIKTKYWGVPFNSSRRAEYIKKQLFYINWSEESFAISNEHLLFFETFLTIQFYTIRLTIHIDWLSNGIVKFVIRFLTHFLFEHFLSKAIYGSTDQFWRSHFFEDGIPTAESFANVSAGICCPKCQNWSWYRSFLKVFQVLAHSTNLINPFILKKYSII